MATIRCSTCGLPCTCYFYHNHDFVCHDRRCVEGSVERPYDRLAYGDDGSLPAIFCEYDGNRYAVPTRYCTPNMTHTRSGLHFINGPSDLALAIKVEEYGKTPIIIYARPRPNPSAPNQRITASRWQAESAAYLSDAGTKSSDRQRFKCRFSDVSE